MKVEGHALSNHQLFEGQFWLLILPRTTMASVSIIDSDTFVYTTTLLSECEPQLASWASLTSATPDQVFLQPLIFMLRSFNFI